MKISNKRVLSIILSILIIGMLAGCGNVIPDMTDEEVQKVGEYSAVMMLKYDANHRSRLVDLSLYPDPLPEVAPEPQPEPEPAPQPEPEPEPQKDEDKDKEKEKQEELVQTTLEEFLKLPEGSQLRYNGQSISLSYPEDSSPSNYFIVDATEGKKFLVLHFSLLNLSENKADYDFLTAGYSFRTIVNDGTPKTALITMLSDELSTYIGSLEGGYGEDLVLIYEYDNSIVDNIENIRFQVKSREGTWETSL